MKKDYLIIDRAKWRTGAGGNFLTGKGNTLLLNDEGFMCCLGFRCHQMGIPKNDLLGICTPGSFSLSSRYDIPDLIEEKPWGWDNSSFVEDAVKINDDMFLTPEQREKAITEHFKKIGVTVEFKGRYKKSKV